LENNRNPAEFSKDVESMGKLVKDFYQTRPSTALSFSSQRGSRSGEKERHPELLLSKEGRVSHYNEGQLEINLGVLLTFSSLSGSMEPAFFSIPFQNSFFLS
jgi:hypothetical protein